MVRKILHVFLIAALMITLFPLYPQPTQADTGDNFVFDNPPTSVNTDRITLTGTLNNVSPSGITYTVERMSSSDFSTATVLQKKDRSSLGITVSPDGTRITVTNLTLFPGVNRITFYGKRGASEVSTVLHPITYIDSPILYNLAFTGAGQKAQINETGVTIVTNAVASNPSQGLFSIEGNAPNAREVVIDFGDNQSRSGTVREDGTNYFIVSQIKLKKGKNTLKFHVKNDTQNVEVVRDVVYYDGSVTFFDSQLNYTSTSSSSYDLRLLSSFFVPDNTASNYTITGKVIVPNDFQANKSEPMRIEAAYRLAGASGSSNSAYNPDTSDSIVIRFSAPVQGAANMTANELKSWFDFQTTGANPVSLNEKIKDSTATWTSATINGSTIDKSQLVINIGPQDAANGAFNNVGRIVLKKTVVSANDPNSMINVLASNSETTPGVTAVNPVWDSGTITVTGDNTNKFAVSFKGFTVTLDQAAAYSVQPVDANNVTVHVTDITDPSEIATGIEDGFTALDNGSNALSNFTFSSSSVNKTFTITGKNPVATYNGDTVTFSTIAGPGTLSFANQTSQGVLVATTAGVAPVPEVNTIVVNSGVTTVTPVTIDIYDSYLSPSAISISFSLAATDVTADDVASKIRTQLNSNTTITGTGKYTVGGSGNVVTLTQNGTGSAVNPTITITKDAEKYAQVVPLAGSFDPRTPYVTEAYVVGSSASTSTRGVDAGEKIIIQLKNGTNTTLGSSWAGKSPDSVLKLVNTLTGASQGSSGKLGSSPSAYTLNFNSTSNQLEVVFNNTTGLHTDITKPRSLDNGVGDSSAVSFDLSGVVTGSAFAAFQTPLDLSTVRIGGSFDADGGSPNPDPATIAAQSAFAHAIFWDENLTMLDQKNFTLTQISGGGFTYRDTDPYYVFQYTISGSAIPSGALAFDKQRYIQFEAVNTKKTRQAGGSLYYEGTEQTDLGYILRDSNKPYLESLKYTDGVDITPTTTFSSFEQSGVSVNDLKDGTTINKLPFAVKLTIPNAGPSMPASSYVSLTISSTSASGAKSTPTTIASNRIYTNVSGTTREVWFFVESLPFNGTQKLDITYQDTTPGNTFTITTSVTVTVVSGINVRFDGITENQVVKYDPTLSKTERANQLVRDALQDFKGQFSNVTIQSTDYSGSSQKVFLTVNNNDVPLEANGTDANKFILDDGVSGSVNSPSAMPAVREKILDYFNPGQNTIKIRYVGTGITYEKTFTITYFSLNYPEIRDVYPYGTDRVNPDRDTRYQGSNGSYVTKQPDMNIFGSFDFIDLGTSYTQINAKRNSSSIDANKFLLIIKGPNGQEWKWDLKTNSFTDTDGKTYSGSSPTDGLTVTYDTNGQFFTFILKNQKLPTDGSKAVYNFYVYNEGVNGSSASFRLEVGTSGLPYKLLKPYLPQQSTVNQNYLEVVLYAENADSVTVNKVEAEKFDFDANYDGDIDDNDYKGAFRAIVKDLKPNKSNKITFTITRGNDKITDSFEVFYALANMPGAQYMETMKASHKVFDGKLTLSFPKDTYLRRADYNVPDNLRTQLFKQHNILFAIANSQDGVVDRYDYVTPKPRGFSDLVEELGLRFRSSFDTHFSMASEVYWIDAGLADNPDTTEYDPYTSGLLPHQLPYSDLPSYDSVPPNRILVPNKRGTLELAYDSNIVNDASNNITVMRYDPENQYWENLGGQVNPSKKTIKIPFDKFGYYVVAKMNDSFQDVIQHPYARNQIEAMYSKGVIKPKRSNEFGPDDETTRAEFTAMVVRALQLPLIEKPLTYTFDDVPTVVDPNDLWDYRYIETAARLGLVRGTNPRIFDPNSKITRQDASIILARALQLKTETVPAKVDKDLQKLFKDFNLIDPYARPSVLAIAKKKFIVGSPVDQTDLKKGYIFEPNAIMLRGDAAILMARVMADLKKIPPVAEVR